MHSGTSEYINHVKLFYSLLIYLFIYVSNFSVVKQLICFSSHHGTIISVKLFLVGRKEQTPGSLVKNTTKLGALLLISV